MLLNAHLYQNIKNYRNGLFSSWLKQFCTMRMAHNLLSTAWVISWSGRMRYGPPQAFAIAFSRLPSTLSPLQVWATRSCDWKTKSLAHPSNCDLEKTKPSADEITQYTIWEPWCFLASGGKISLCIWCERGHVLQLEMVGRLDALKLRCLWMKPYRNDVENYGLQVPAPKILYPITTCASSGWDFSLWLARLCD